MLCPFVGEAQTSGVNGADEQYTLDLFALGVCTVDATLAIMHERSYVWLLSQGTKSPGVVKGFDRATGM